MTSTRTFIATVTPNGSWTDEPRIHAAVAGSGEHSQYGRCDYYTTLCGRRNFVSLAGDAAPREFDASKLMNPCQRCSKLAARQQGDTEQEPHPMDEIIDRALEYVSDNYFASIAANSPLNLDRVVAHNREGTRVSLRLVLMGALAYAGSEFEAVGKRQRPESVDSE